MNTSLILCAVALGAAGAAVPGSPHFLHLKATTGPQPPVVLDGIGKGADLLPLPPGAYADLNLAPARPVPAGVTDQIDPLEVEALLSAAAIVKHVAPPLQEESPLMAQRLLDDPWVGEDAPLPDLEFAEGTGLQEQGHSDNLGGMTGDMETLKKWEANAPKLATEDPALNLPTQPVANMEIAPTPRSSSREQPLALPADALMNWFQDMKAPKLIKPSVLGQRVADVETVAPPVARSATVAAPQQRAAREQPAIQSQLHPMQLESLAPAGEALDRKYSFNMRTQQWELSSVRSVTTGSSVSQTPVQQQAAPRSVAAAEPRPIAAPVVAAAPRPFVADREPSASKAKANPTPPWTEVGTADKTNKNLHTIKPTEKETELLKSLLKAESDVPEIPWQRTDKAAVANELTAKEVQAPVTEYRLADQSVHAAAPQQPVQKVQVQVPSIVEREHEMAATAAPPLQPIRSVQVQVPSIVELEHEMAATAAQVEKAEKAVAMSSSSEQAVRGVVNVASSVSQLRSQWAAQELQRHNRVVEAQRKFIAAQRYMSQSNAMKRQKIMELRRVAAAHKANIRALEEKVRSLEKEKQAALGHKAEIHALNAKVNALEEERQAAFAHQARVDALDKEKQTVPDYVAAPRRKKEEDAPSPEATGSVGDLMRLGSVWEGRADKLADLTTAKGSLAAPISFRIAENAGEVAVAPRGISARQMRDATATARFLDAHSTSRLQQMLPEEEAAAAGPVTNDADETEMATKLTEHFLNLGDLWDKVQSGADAA